MDKLAAMQSFVTAVDAGGFSAAARRLGLSQPAVSQHVRSLEEELGARLLNRSTRSIELTERGASYYDHTLQILSRLNEAEAAVRGPEALMTGRLKVAAPAPIAEKVLFQFLIDFAADHPSIDLDLSLDVSQDALSVGDYDVALHVGAPVDDRLIITRVGGQRDCLIAAPSYLAQHGAIEKPEDLNAHRFLTNRGFSELTLQSANGEEVKVRPHACLRSDSALVLRSAALRGLGVIDCNQVVSDEFLRRGAVRLVLPQWRLPERVIYAIYPPNRVTAAKTRRFVEMLRHALRHIDEDQEQFRQQLAPNL